MAGELVIDWPPSGAGSSFTTANTFLTATVDDSTIAGGEPLKVATDSNTWTVTMPAAYVATPVKVALNYVGFAYAA
jgi:hypothetical protein